MRFSQTGRRTPANAVAKQLGWVPVVAVASAGTWKTTNGLAVASIKTVNGLAKASIKTADGLTP